MDKDFYGNNGSDNKQEDSIFNSLINIVEDKLAKFGSKYYKIFNTIIIAAIIILIIPIAIIGKNMISKNDYTIIPIILIIIFIVLQILLLIAFFKVKKVKDGIVKGYKVFNSATPVIASLFKNEKKENGSLHSSFVNNSINSNINEQGEKNDAK